MAARPDRGRLLRATAASATTGAVVYLIVMQWALPAVQTRLTPSQIEWLRDAMMHHHVAVLVAIVVIAGVLGLPVLMVFRWIYGPVVVGK
jgi:hypothetical protein